MFICCDHQYQIALQMLVTPYWIATPHIGPDHRGPVDRPVTTFGGVPSASLRRGELHPGWAIDGDS